MSKVPSYKQLFKNTTIFGGAQIFTVLAGVVRNKVAAELVGKVGIGMNGLYVSLNSFISNITGLGVSTSSVPSLSKCYEEKSECEFSQEVAIVRQLALFTCLLGGLLTIAISPFLSKIYYGDYSSIQTFVMLAVVVVSTVMTNAEMAILKSMRRSKEMALLLMVNAIISVVVAIPFYSMWGLDGIIRSLVLTGLSSMILTVAVSYRVSPYKAISIDRNVLYEKIRPIVYLGLSFVLAGLASTGMELIIQTYMESNYGFETLGLYRAGYQISIVYTGMIFSAINMDFYPRLSAIIGDKQARNELIRRQTKVLLSISAPLIIIFVVVTPWIIALLLSQEFAPIVGMVRWASLSIIVKSMYLSLGFLPLADKKSSHFLILEFISYLLLGVSVIVGYDVYGLTGIGIGILVSNILDAILIYVYSRIVYEFK